MMTLQHCLIVSVLLFAFGAVGAVSRRNVLMILMSIELMFAAAGLAMLSFARWNLLPEGQAAVIFFIAVMAAEAAVGLGLIVVLYRRRRTVFVDDLRLLRG